MHIALSHGFSPNYDTTYLEAGLRSYGHKVTFIGPPGTREPGFDTYTPLTHILAALPEPPDIYFFFEPGGRYFPPGIEDLPIPTVCWLGDIHLGTWREQMARFFDLVLLPHRDYVARYRQVVGHDQVHWLPLYLPPGVQEMSGPAREYEVGFVGTLARAHRHTPRARRLALIARHFHTNDLYRFYPHAELSEVYSRSRLVCNVTIGGDVNLRLFEGTACGALVLTDSAANGLEELFQIGREIVVYRDDADLLAKARYYLAHEDERTRIAAAGQQRTLRDHTYAQRVQALLATLARSPLQRLAPMRRADAATRLASRRVIYTHIHALDLILDAARDAHRNPLQRAWAILPCLMRRLVL
jgi:hypothetical protein